MLNEIKLTIEQAKLFGIIDNKKIKQPYIELDIKEIKEDEEKIEVFYSYSIETNFSSSANAATDSKITFTKPIQDFVKAVFVTWASAESGTGYGGLEADKNRATNTINKLIHVRNKSCYPYYIAYKYNLRGSDIFESVTGDLYSVKESPDTFPDYYLLLWKKDSNKLRAIGAVREGNNKFPRDFRLGTILASHYLNEKEYSKAIDVLKEIPESAIHTWYENNEITYLKFTAYLESGLFNEAEQMIRNCRSSIGEKKFFLGVLSHRTKDYDKAILYLIESIEHSSEDDDCVIGAFYYLISSYLSQNKIAKAFEVLNLLPSKDHDFRIEYYGMEYAAIAEQAISLLLKQETDELLHAKAKAILAFIKLKSYLPDTDITRALTPKENNILEEILAYAKVAVGYYPSNSFYNYIYSQILLLNKQFDEAQSHLVVATSKNSDFPCGAILENCSEDFLDNYDKVISNLFDSGALSVDEYTETSIKSDVEILFKTKRYGTIVDLINRIEKDSDLTQINKKDSAICDVLFDIAYSFKEAREIENSKKYYLLISKMGKETSASLNNLAIIYEEEEDKKMAEKTIKMAKKLLGKNGKDNIVERNYARLVTHSKAEKDKKAQNVKAREKKLPSFSPKDGNILLNSINIFIAEEGSYQYHICNVLLAEKRSLTEWVKEQDLEDSYSFGSPKSGRWVRDAIYKINAKIRGKTQIKIFLEYNSARVRVNPAVL